jgi:hypothetical protein
MKIWRGYGSEHSMNLVMIGRFENVGTAEEAKQIIERLTEQVRDDDNAGLMRTDGSSDRFTDGMLDLLQKIHIHILSPVELEQFAYDFDIKVDDTKLVMKTDESDVSAILKILVDKGARVEVYSAHHFPDTPYGRGK